MYKVNFHSYCGMAGIPEEFDNREDAEQYAAHRIRRLRKLTKVSTITTGTEWEAQEPEGCHMVPDYAGLLVLKHITFECRECGSPCETPDEANECCAFHEDYIED